MQGDGGAPTPERPTGREDRKRSDNDARAAELEAQIAASIEHREQRTFDVRHDLTRVRAP